MSFVRRFSNATPDDLKLNSFTRPLHLLLLLLAVGEWPIPQPLRAEAFSRPSAQPVSIQRCVCVCVYQHKAEVSAYACVVSSLCPVYFTSPATLRLPSTTLASPSQPTHTGRESVDQWSRVPAGTMVEQIASIAAVINAWMLPAFTVYRGQRRILFPARD